MVSLAYMFFIRSETGSDQGPRFRLGSLRENILDNNSNKTPENAIFRVKPVLYTPGQSLFAITVRLKT